MPVRRKSLLPSLVAGGMAAAVLVVPPLVSAFSSSPAVGPAFPTRVASYSWWTTPLAPSTMDAATAVYQNGVGVEFMDVPQAVVLGEDGASYRRLTAAEELSVPEDQSDPQTLLSADGTFAVVAGGGGQGAIEVVTLRDLERRTVAVGAGRSAVPVSIDASGKSVLLLTSDANMSPYTDFAFRLHGSLTRLDLETGELLPYDVTDAHAAAISPDGSRIVADTPDGLLLVDAASGTVTDTGLRLGGATLDGDAWAPDGRSFAVLDEGELRILDGSQAGIDHTVPVSGVEYGSVIGWRDADTVLVHAGIPGDDNGSQFVWVDAATGSAERFSVYAPDVTGAALAGADVARSLVGEWRVLDRVPDRGPVSALVAVTLGLIGAGLVGLLTWALTPRRARP